MPPVDGKISWTVINVSDGVYMLEPSEGHPGANLGLLSGDDGVVLIDNGLPYAASVTIDTVEGTAGAPVDFLINTHAHLDHVGGNAAYVDVDAVILAHDHARQSMEVDARFDKKGLPQLTFSDGVTLYLNGQSTTVHYAPAAHTDSDVFVHFNEANVIHAGDLFFNKIFPFIDLENGGSLDGFIDGLSRVVEIADDETKIIPGHGKLASRSDLKEALNMLIDSKMRVKVLVDKGMTIEQVLHENPLSVYSEWDWFRITTEKITTIIYDSLKE